MMASELVRRHRLLELFGVRIMGFSLDAVDEEAERLEHAVSDAFVERMDALLGHPKEDPHGDPIPDRTGRTDALPSWPLTSIRASQQVIIQRVSDEDLALLRYLSELALVPGTKLAVVEVAPFGGVYTVQIGNETRTLGEAVAQALFVRPVAPHHGNASRSFSSPLGEHA
jgi:DtxR family Mn-dependent transcriptional regulator